LRGLRSPRWVRSAAFRAPSRSAVCVTVSVAATMPRASNGYLAQEDAEAMASRPSTAASAAIMNAANSSGSRSSQLRAASRMPSNAIHHCEQPGQASGLPKSALNLLRHPNQPSRNHAVGGTNRAGDRQASGFHPGSRGPGRGEPRRLGDRRSWSLAYRCP
jgi:hypothetical protein